jgi:hypothetical protein
MKTDIITLRNADWPRIEREVVEKIRMLKAIADGLPANAINDKIAHDLVLPALNLLGRFCACVTVEEEK